MMLTLSTALDRCCLLAVRVLFSCKIWGVFPDLLSVGEPILECSVLLSTTELFSSHECVYVCACVCERQRDRDRQRQRDTERLRFLGVFYPFDVILISWCWPFLATFMP